MKNRKKSRKSRNNRAHRNSLERRLVGTEKLEKREMFSVDLMPGAGAIVDGETLEPQPCDPSFVYEFADGSVAATADCQSRLRLPLWWPNPHHPSLNQHNGQQPTDVNGDGLTTSEDALRIIHELNSNGPYKVPHFRTLEFRRPGDFRNYDTNGDGYVTAADALTVINALNNPEDPSAPNVEPGVDRIGAVVPLPLPPRTCMVPWGCGDSLDEVVTWTIPHYDDNVVDMKPVFADDSEGEYRAMNENTEAATFRQAPAVEKSSTEDYFTQLGNNTLDPLDTGIFADTGLLSSLQ